MAQRHKGWYRWWTQHSSASGHRKVTTASAIASPSSSNTKTTNGATSCAPASLFVHHRRPWSGSGESGPRAVAVAVKVTVPNPATAATTVFAPRRGTQRQRAAGATLGIGGNRSRRQHPPAAVTEKATSAPLNERRFDPRPRQRTARTKPIRQTRPARRRDLRQSLRL